VTKLIFLPKKKNTRNFKIICFELLFHVCNRIKLMINRCNQIILSKLRKQFKKMKAIRNYKITSFE